MSLLTEAEDTVPAPRISSPRGVKMPDSPVSRLPPPGWYLDPYQKTLLRWWDGQRWAGPTRDDAHERSRSRLPRESTVRVEQSGHQSFQSRGKHRQPLPVPPPRAMAGRGTMRSPTSRNLPLGLASSDRRWSCTTRLGLSALFGGGLVLVATGYVFDVSLLRLVGVLATVFFGVGTAPLQLLERPSLGTRLGVAGLVGLAILALTSSVMSLLPAWHPWLAAAVVAMIALALHISACRRALSELATCPSARLHTASLLNASIACSLAGTALWCIAAFGLGRITPRVGGFLPEISPSWYAGLILLLTGIALARGKHESYAMFAITSLVSALTLTPALAYGMPRSQSASKHVELVQLLLRTHHLDRGAGIYETYSGFFSTVSWICELSRTHDPIIVAAYWPFIIGLVGIVELRFLFVGVIRSRYRIAVAMTLAVLANAIGADYFSPQSVGFILGLAIYALALGGDDLGFDNRVRVVFLASGGCAIAITHELSPYIVGTSLAILVLFRVVRPWYLPATCLLPACLWAALNWQVVSHFVSFDDLGNLSNFTPPKTVSTPGLQRLPIVNQSSHALLMGLMVLIALAGVGFLANALRLQSWRLLPPLSAWGIMISAGAGLLLIAANPYGNEGIFRSALFGIPWLATLAAVAAPRNPPSWLRAPFSLISVGLLGTFLVAMFGLDNAGVMRPADFQALRIFETRAPESSYLLDLSYGDIPGSVTFPDSGHSLPWSSMVTAVTFKPGRPDAADAIALAHRYARYAAEKSRSSPDNLYAIWSPASADYSLDYGLETLAHARLWRKLIAASPDWKVVFSSNGTYLFRVAIPKARPPVANHHAHGPHRKSRRLNR